MSSKVNQYFKNKKNKNSFSNATKKQISENKLMNLLKILPDTLDNILKLNKKSLNSK